MEKHRLLSIHVSLIVFVGANLSACSHTATLPEPQTASGVYVHSGFEYYRWEEGLRLMIWHDGINHVSCSTSTNNRRFEIECNAIAYTNNSFEWHLETNDGITAKFIIDDHLFDLSDGNLFIATSLGEDTEVRQLKRDLSDVQANASSVTEFGLSDLAILEFIKISSEIKDCISDCVSSSTTPKDRLDSSDVEFAQQALVAFFSYLRDGDYERASALYGGEYDGMRDHNPDIDPDDHAALFQKACTVNGAQCLEIQNATLLAQPSPAEYQFTVVFSKDDSSIFARGPCCGDNDPSSIEQTEFIYTVRLECIGKYFVMETPVYLP
jgi:hypothetical protein